MTTYHINSSGVPALCKATKRPCPLGGAEAHYGTLDQATTAAEKQMRAKFGMLGNDKQVEIDELKQQIENTKSPLGKCKLQNQIKAIELGFSSVKEYYKFKAEIRKNIAQETPELTKRETEIEKDCEVLMSNKTEEYQYWHKPTEEGPTADNMESDELGCPEFYSHPQRFGRMSDESFSESVEALKAVRDNPDAMITVYRATPGNNINNEDWVTLSLTYAENHNNQNLSGNGNILKKQVRAKDIRFAGDDIREFGYYPQETKS